MNKNLKCSCIVLNYNDADTTVELLNQIENFGCIEEICVVDNASTDDSFVRLKKKENDKIIVIKSEKNGGYGYGNNYGIRFLSRYKSKYILIMNPDVIIEENVIEKLLRTLERDPECAMVSAVPLSSQNKKKERPGWNLGALPEYVLGMCIFYGKLKNIFENRKKRGSIAKYDCIQGSLFMTRIEDMIEIGMYDEEVFLYCEEDIIGWKFKKKGKYGIILNDEFYIHNHSVSTKKNIGSIFKRNQLLFKSILYFIKKYYAPKTIVYKMIRIYASIVLFINVAVIKCLSVVRRE